MENDLLTVEQTVQSGWDRRDAGAPPWSLVLLDLCFYTGRVTPPSDERAAGMPEGRTGEDTPGGYFGIRVLEHLHERFPLLPVVILSAQDRSGISHKFTLSGALDFLPRGERESLARFQQVLWQHGLLSDPLGEIVGRSLSMLVALRSARRVAGEPRSAERRHVLLRGERGTGKELLARYINRRGGLSTTQPLVPVDCGAIQPTLWASELFGHALGSFTDAKTARVGRITDANGGDLFLDEIGNIPPEAQAGLLRVLESRAVTQVGANIARPVDVRVISATNGDIELESVGGRFRADLLDRLREGGTVTLPPLKARSEDVPLLIEYFVRQAEREVPRALARTIDAQTVDAVLSLEWPDNLRGLRNCIRKAVADHPGLDYLVPDHVLLSRAEQTGSAPENSLPRPQPPTAAFASPAVPSSSGPAAPTQSKEFQIPAQLAGSYADVERSVARFLASYLKAVLEATKKVTATLPSGEISIHRAMKFAKGTEQLTASKASDIVKRFLSFAPEHVDDLVRDPTLKEALETAKRLRPSKRRQ